MSSTAFRGSWILLVLTVLAAAGCGGSKNGPTQPDPDPGPAAGVVVTDAVPSSGNGTLTGVSITIVDTTIAMVPGKHIQIRGTVNPGTVSKRDHRIDILFKLSNGSVASVTHRWAASLSPGQPLEARNACTTCDGAKVSINQSTKKVTLNGLVLPDDGINPGNTSTLTGVNTYP